MGDIFGKNKIKISIEFHKKDSEWIKNYFTTFVDEMEHVANQLNCKFLKPKNLFVVKEIQSTTQGKSSDKKILIDEDNVYYTLAYFIDNYDLSIEVFTALAVWRDSNPDIDARLEAVCGFFKFPIFYMVKEKVWFPPRTYIDMKLLSNKDVDTINSLNKAIYDRRNQ